MVDFRPERLINLLFSTRALGRPAPRSLASSRGRAASASGRGRPAPAIDPETGVAYAGGHDNSVYAFDVETGAVLWSSATGGWIIGALTVTAGTVLASSCDSHLYAFDKETGKRRWRVDHGGQITSGVVPNDGRLYYAERAVFGGEDIVSAPGRVYCLVANE